MCVSTGLENLLTQILEHVYEGSHKVVQGEPHPARVEER